MDPLNQSLSKQQSNLPQLQEHYGNQTYCFYNR